MKEGKNKTLIIILVSVIVILLAVLGYGLYTGFKVKAMIISLNADRNSLTLKLNDTVAKLDDLQGKYDLLTQDVAKIYKGCMKDNACKGRFPNVSWYCNNVGDEVSDPSHICFCDSSCNLNVTEIKR